MVCYNKLWKMLIDKKMKKKDLIARAKLTTYVMNRLAHDDDVSTDTLAKICVALDCQIEDIIEIVPDDDYR